MSTQTEDRMILDRCLMQLGEGRVVSPVPGGMLVRTDVLLPHYGSCVVMVETNHGGRVVATDGGAAISSVTAAGFDPGSVAFGSVIRAVKRHDLYYDDGIIKSPEVPVEEVVHAVVIVANAMRDVAFAALDSARRIAKNRFRDRVYSQLMSIFREETVRKKISVLGSSSESLRFDFGVMSGKQTLVIDAPVPEPASIAAVYLRQSDLKRAHLSTYRQAILIDEKDRWPSSALSQLGLADVPILSQRGLDVRLHNLMRSAQV